MNEYKVQYSYERDDRRVYEEDTSLAWNSSEAVQAVREEYEDLPGLRIETVWIDRGSGWDVIETWTI